MRKLWFLGVFAVLFGISDVQAGNENDMYQRKSMTSRGNISQTARRMNGRTYKWLKTGARKLDAKCILDASERFNVPVTLILGILDVERGEVGMVVSNTNRSYDLGPMQINTIHMEKLGSLGITRSELAKIGCLNVEVGTWLLRRHLDETNGNILEAVGRYHSFNEPYKTRYKKLFAAAYKRLKKNPMQQIKAVIERSNKSFEK